MILYQITFCPDNDLKKICDFIKQDVELEKIIYNLKNLIKNEVSEIKAVQMNFYPEFQEDELILEINALSDLDAQTSLKIENNIQNKLYKTYSESAVDKILVYINNSLTD